MQIRARDFRTGCWIEIEIRDEHIAAVQPVAGPAKIQAHDEWVAPAFWDIQVNGRWGRSFSSPDLTVQDVISIVSAQSALGTARLCPTLISAPAEDTLRALATIAEACAVDPALSRAILGIHLEGPFLSHLEGYRGAHPADVQCDPDFELFEKFHAASGGRIRLLTLAPERAGALPFIEQVSRRGVVVALGHTAADGPTIDAAVAAGAKLSTHLGNGIVAQLPRHPNPIWHQAALDSLHASVIADGDHLDLATLRVLARAKGPRRLIVVSDACPLAGLPAGTYGPWAIDGAGLIVVAGTPYLAGSGRSLAVGVANLLRVARWPIDRVLGAVTFNPARLLNLSPPELAPGHLANLILFQHAEPTQFVLLRTLAHGAWHEVEA
jgi:N-acetylglucosamine-6-phosphate deacetylase